MPDSPRDTTTSAASNADGHNYDSVANDPHAVDHPDRGVALTGRQQSDAIHAHLRAAMPQEYPGGRTTDPAAWRYTPENLDRLAASTRAADARRRACADRLKPEESATAVKPANQQQHDTRRPGQGRGPGRVGCVTASGQRAWPVRTFTRKPRQRVHIPESRLSARPPGGRRVTSPEHRPGRGRGKRGRRLLGGIDRLCAPHPSTHRRR